MELQFLRELINQIAATRQICLCWTPGHVGINPNEAADLLAKSALSAPSTDLDMLAYFPSIFINRYFRFLDYNYFQRTLLDTRDSYSWLQHKINYSVFPDRFYFRIYIVIVNNSCSLKAIAMLCAELVSNDVVLVKNCTTRDITSP